MIKIYWFFKLLKFIQENNVIQVQTIINKHFSVSNVFFDKLFDFNKNLFNYSYSYSYDCFIYFLKKIKENKKDFYPNHYQKLKLKNNKNNNELEKIFHFKYITEGEEVSEEIEYNYSMQLKSQIILLLIKNNEFELIEKLIVNLSQELKNGIFKVYFTKITITPDNEKTLKKIISLFNIECDFFVSKVLNYYERLNESQYKFLKENYSISKDNWLTYFLMVDNEYIIEDLLKTYDINIKLILNKINMSLRWSYEYHFHEDLLEKIMFFKRVNLLTEENIIKSFNKDLYPIDIDYRYIPLLNVSKATEDILIKNNLRIIIYYKTQSFLNCDKHDLEQLLDNYFKYLKDNNIELDLKFLKEMLESSITSSEKIGVYFYKKFPDLFFENASVVFDRLINSYQDYENNYLLNEIINEPILERKEIFLNAIVRAITNRYFYQADNNKIYFFLKDHLSLDLKEKILHKKSHEKDILPVLIDLLKEDYFLNKINDIFINCIKSGNDTSNAQYILENYNINNKILTQAFISLSYYKLEENAFEIVRKILEKDIELDTAQLQTLQDNEIEMYRLYQSYYLKRKLQNKLEIKEVKTKKIKI